MRYVFRPLGAWPGPSTPQHQRRSRATFRASWQNTLDLLARELKHLGAKNVAILADFRERDLRLDGMPRGDARAPQHPGVRIAFDSRHGPLTYATDEYEYWQHNVRAIALALEALRAVDRHGVSKTGQQYRGWAQLEAGPSAPFSSLDDAAAFVVKHSGEHADGGDLMVAPGVVDGDMLTRLYRLAARRLHPDGGGNDRDFMRLQQAKAQLEKAVR